MVHRELADKRQVTAGFSGRNSSATRLKDLPWEHFLKRRASVNLLRPLSSGGKQHSCSGQNTMEFAFTQMLRKFKKMWRCKLLITRSTKSVYTYIQSMYTANALTIGSALYKKTNKIGSARVWPIKRSWLVGLAIWQGGSILDREECGIPRLLLLYYSLKLKKTPWNKLFLKYKKKSTSLKWKPACLLKL